MMVSKVVIENTVTGERLELDHKKTPSYILEEFNVDPIDGAISTQDMISRDGTSITNVRFGTRSAALSGWIVGTDDLEISGLRRRLNRMVNPKQPISVVFNGHRVTGVPISTIVYGSAVGVLNDKMCRFYFSLLCENPLIQEEFTKQELLSNWESMLHFPLEFNLPDNTLIFGLRSVSKVIRVTNASDVPVGLRVIFEALSEVKVPRLTNITLQKYLEINRNLAAYEKDIVDGTGKYVTAYAYLPNQDPQSIANDITDDSTIPMILPVGVSMFTYSAEHNADGLQITLEFNPSYLEVL